MYLEKSRGMIRLNSLESSFCIEMRGRLAGAQRPASGWHLIQAEGLLVGYRGYY